MTQPIPLPRFIVCAACLIRNHIVTGVRHFDVIMTGQLALFIEKENVALHEVITQGFVDNKGSFLTREEAWIIARDSLQIKVRVGGDEGRLFSENIY